MQKRNLATISRKDIIDLVVDALKSLGGKGTIVQVASKIWETYGAVLEQSGEIFYTWQYDIRWARHKLAADGVLKTKKVQGKSLWILV